MKTEERKELPTWSSLEKLEPNKNEALRRQGESKHREEEGSGEGPTTKKPTTLDTTTTEIPETTAQSSQHGQTVYLSLTPLIGVLNSGDQCKSCPSLFMDHNVDGQLLCSNWKHVQVMM